MADISIDDLSELAASFVAAEPEHLKTAGWWQPPLLATAPVDARFDRLPDIASSAHFHPCDLLPGARTVIAFFIPFVKKLVKENRAGDRPTRDWGLSYVDTNSLIGRLSQALAEGLRREGYHAALTPATHHFDEAALMARWSHKHLGYLAGLGRFGVHHLLITEAGCAGRLGSLVTDADVGDHPSVTSEEACLLKAGRRCGKCLKTCPVDALAADGFERRACWNRLNENRRNLEYFSDLPPSTHVCGKCLAVVPCSFLNPAKRVSRHHDVPDSHA